MQPRSILISTAYYPPHMGGVEVFSQSIARELASRGIEVAVVTNRLDGTPARERLDDGVEVLRAPAADPSGRYPILLRSPAAVAFWRELESRAFDAVVVNTRFYPISVKAANLARRRGLRPLLVEHGSGYLRIGHPVADAAVRAVERAATWRVRAADPVCCGVSREAGEWLSEFGLSARGTVRNSIDASAFRAQASSRDFRVELGMGPEERIVAFSGRLIPEKGIWTLAEIARLLEGTGVRFLVAGDGPARAELDGRRPADISVLGRLSRPDMAALLLQADAFCFPSVYPEGLPTSLLEAAACEAFIVSAPVAGAREVVPDASFGCVAEAADAPVLCAALLDALEDEPAMRAAARRCRARVEQELSWPCAAESLLSLLDSTMRPTALPTA